MFHKWMEAPLPSAEILNSEDNMKYQSTFKIRFKELQQFYL